MAEYIEREAAEKIARKYGCGNGSTLGRHSGLADCIADEISNLPAADVVEVVRGRWVLGKVEPGYFTPGGNRCPWICSECGYLASWMLDSPTYNYCPNCGAKMDLEGRPGEIGT